MTLEHSLSKQTTKVIALAKNNKFHAQTKHIDIQYHFVHEAVKNRKIKMEYIPTSKNFLDIFTKALLKPKFMEFVQWLGLEVINEWQNNENGCLNWDKQ